MEPLHIMNAWEEFKAQALAAPGESEPSPEAEAFLVKVFAAGYGKAVEKVAGISDYGVWKRFLEGVREELAAAGAEWAQEGEVK